MKFKDYADFSNVFVALEHGNYVVYGEVFTEMEKRKVVDFYAYAEGCGITEIVSNELVKFYLPEGSIGERLFFAFILGITELNVILLSEKDERIINIAQELISFGTKK